MNLSGFAAQHWVIGGTAASLLWFVGGQQYRQSNRPGVAFCWVFIAVLLIAATGGWAVRDKEWAGLITAALVLFIELRQLRRIWQSQASRDKPAAR